MTVTIPRAELDAVMNDYGQPWPADGDSDSTTVRAAAVIRSEAEDAFGARFEEVSRRVLMSKLADDLDALADRYEATR
ncbi:hypothetical protein Ade02nite_20600 [Paractinoplanes deccanensis]|uniref:Uncharacterized protein n=1 Tax=Paractinoplanes deccanensis TaxID=113561 RepID=A0ABQ3Y087_9ACTN|nr:hypothetical protein [Actinoplanes deccanensis]GID73419.1 hypothetical protein Ade02nite_20600 [Actinoplanes deccanensis]